MATAVKPTQETTPSQPRQQLLTGSLLGAAYVLFSLGLVFGGLPMLWQILDLGGLFNVFLASALLLLVTVVTIPVLFLLGRQLEGSNPQPGVRAGAFLLAAAFVLILLLTLGIGNSWFQGRMRMDPTLGTILTAAIGIGLLALLLRLATRPGFSRWLVEVEENGWFHAISFKPNQGLRVRRGTVVGLLVLGVCGIYVLWSHGTLGRGNWEVDIPFMDPVVSIIFIRQVDMVVPVVLLALLGWFTWRVVNWPKFADFLIATEAEMNKVSWTTRKRLFQDTVVVLVTVVLLTVFLFVVDILWIRILSNPFLRVLEIDPQEERAKQNAPQQW